MIRLVKLYCELCWHQYYNTSRKLCTYVQGTTNVTGAINSETDVQVGVTSVLTSAQNDAVALAIALG